MTGFCPDENNRHPNFCRFKGFLLSISPLLVVIFMIFSASRLMTSNPLVIYQCILDCVSFGMVTLKIIPYNFLRQKILRMVKDARHRLKEKKTYREEEIFKIWQANENRVTKFLVLSYFLAFIFHVTTPLFKEGRAFPMISNYSELLLESPWYEIIYALQIMLSFFTCSAMITCDLLGIFFVFYLSYEMKCIALLMQKIGKRKSKLKKSIERYRYAYNYGEHLCSLMSVIFYIEMILCALTTCIAGTMLLKARRPSVVFQMIILLISLIGHQSIDCFLGEMITTANMNVTTAIHESCWYQLHNKKDLKSLYILLLRDEKPLRLVVGTACVVNLKALLDSISWACSYMMVLKTLISNDYTN